MQNKSYSLAMQEQSSLRSLTKTQGPRQIGHCRAQGSESSAERCEEPRRATEATTMVVPSWYPGPRAARSAVRSPTMRVNNRLPIKVYIETHIYIYTNIYTNIYIYIIIYIYKDVYVHARLYIDVRASIYIRARPYNDIGAHVYRLARHVNILARTSM